MTNSEVRFFEKLYGHWRKFASCNVRLFDDEEHVKRSLGMKLACLLSSCL